MDLGNVKEMPKDQSLALPNKSVTLPTVWPTSHAGRSEIHLGNASQCLGWSRTTRLVIVIRLPDLNPCFLLRNLVLTTKQKHGVGSWMINLTNQLFPFQH